MNAPRTLRVEAGESEDAYTTFARDQMLMLRAAEEKAARARVWRRDCSGLLLGRFHRADPQFAHSPSAPDASVPARREALSRRLSGGRIVPVGPGVVCITLAVPVVDWLDAAAKALRPEQVLNRALRPLLALLRAEGIDAFYPGRDLVTVGGRVIAHASFTVMRDGVAVVEMQVAETASFPLLGTLLDRLDPRGIAGVDRDALKDATSLVEAGAAPRSDEAWAASFAGHAAASFACETTVMPADESCSPPAADAGLVVAPGSVAVETTPDVTTAHESAARDFTLEPGAMEEGRIVAAGVAMLGVVEASARMRGDRLTGLRITGDLIAPFHTLDDIAAECEGEPFRPANVRKALARALAKPRSFLLGFPDLDELILRMG